MQEPVEIFASFPGRPPSSIHYSNPLPPTFTPNYPNQYVPHYSPTQSITPRQPQPHPEEPQIQRKYSGTLGSTYDYHSQLLYPNSEPFRKDLDRKLTTIQHEELNEYYSRMVVRPSLFAQDKTDHKVQPPPETPICFNLCCVLILVIGLVSLSVCVYLVLVNHPTDPNAHPQSSLLGVEHTMFLRRFNI